VVTDGVGPTEIIGVVALGFLHEAVDLDEFAHCCFGDNAVFFFPDPVCLLFQRAPVLGSVHEVVDAVRRRHAGGVDTGQSNQQLQFGLSLIRQGRFVLRCSLHYPLNHVSRLWRQWVSCLLLHSLLDDGYNVFSCYCLPCMHLVDFGDSVEIQGEEFAYGVITADFNGPHEQIDCIPDLCVEPFFVTVQSRADKSATGEEANNSKDFGIEHIFCPVFVVQCQSPAEDSTAGCIPSQGPSSVSRA